MKKIGTILCCLLTQWAFAQQTSTIVHFAAFQSQLNVQARQQIETLLAQFSASEELQIDVYSFTDDKEAKKQPYTLSEKRNDAVLNFLLQKNYKIKATHTFIGGKLQAEVPNTSEEARAQNRRTLLIVNRVVAVQPKYYKHEKQTGVIPSAPKPIVTPEIFAFKISEEKEMPKMKKETVETEKAMPFLPE